ncbi:MAG: PilZ domain-containing protein [Planctomycetota bacterium]
MDCEVLMMDKNSERRRELRLRYHWPVWFAEDFDETLSQGQMVDVSSTGAAFTCYADDRCPYPGQHVTARFSVPCFASDESFDMANFVRPGRICRVDDISSFLRRVAIQFAEPLPFKPGEQASDESAAEQNLEAATV